MEAADSLDYDKVCNKFSVENLTETQKKVLRSLYEKGVFMSIKTGGAHTTQFTEPGWTYLRHGYGVGKFQHGGTYVTLTKLRDFTIVIETINEGRGTPEDDVKPQNVTFQLKGRLSTIDELNVWYTNTEKGIYFIKKQPLKVVKQEVSLFLGVNEMYTLTTLTSGNKGEYSEPPSSKLFPLPFKEDFERYNISEEPYLFAQQVGAFEVVEVNDGHGHVMRQATSLQPVSWCVAEAIMKPITFIGDKNWKDIFVETEFQLPDIPGKADGVLIALRINYGGCSINLSSAVVFELNITQETYKLTTNFIFEPTYAKGDYTYKKGWNTASLLVQGTVAVGTINGKQVFKVNFIPVDIDAGFVAVGSLGYGYADFDNIQITTPSNKVRHLKNRRG